MPVLDDAFLGTLFNEAGAAFAVPPSGADDIARRARGQGDGGAEPATTAEDGDPGTTPRDAAATDPPRRDGALRSHRLLAVAASVILVTAIAGVTLALAHRTTGSGPAGSRSNAQAVPPTTVPAVHGIAGAPFGTLAPTTVTPSTGSGGANRQPKAVGGTAPVTPSAGQSAKIVQTGTLVLLVPRGKLVSTVTALNALASRAQGMVATSHLRTNVHAPEGSITLQVPVASFATVVHQAQDLGRSQKLTTKATDVTGSYVDLQARIAALDTSRQQYLTIMAKATSVSDILAVQSQLDGLQSQIEQLQGQLALVTNETTYSRVTVDVHEPTPAHHHRPAPPTGIDRAWHDSLHGFAAGVDGIVSLAGPVLFGLLCAALVLLAGRSGWRRWQRHNL